MKGDFSNWRFHPHENFNGLLHQQGKVLTDVDLTDSDRIALHWREVAARDVIGASVAAVPATETHGFEVIAARVETTGPLTRVKVDVHPGRIWADGLLTYLPGNPPGSTAPVTRVATYFEPPIQSPQAAPATLGDNVRDAVILEVAHEEMNGFQRPERLLEPALGGIDTTERIYTRFAFKLFRLGPNQDCHTIGPLLQDNPAHKGKLTVSLTPTTVIPGECPVVAGGGYTGFEHNLYRLEIADTTSATRHFKWSQFNGGLVGRGTFNAAGNPRRVTISANRTAIVNSRLTDFYLEALAFDPDLGHWRVTYGALASLNAQHELTLTDPPVFGVFPGTSDDVFFRLWNGLQPIADFTNAATPAELRDDIHLVFDPPTATNYRPGDFWTFTVRAGEVENEPVLIDHQPPDGVVYHRVPLAEIHWTARLNTKISGFIEDCRRRFRPLTNQKVCCSFLVGDGVQTFGDFNSLEEAAAHLPPAGGELCLLPGIHSANLRLENRANITIHGCPRRTLVIPRMPTKTDPIVHLVGTTGIRIYDLDLVSFDGTPILAQGNARQPLQDLRIEDNRILASREGLRVDDGADVVIARNLIFLLDTSAGLAAVSLEADDTLIERNRLGVWPVADTPPQETPGDDSPDNPADPCAESNDFYADPILLLTFASYVWGGVVTAVPANPYRALGGIHLRAGSERVRVLENDVRGGAGNGITLGGLLSPADAPAPEPGPMDNPPAPAASVTLTQTVFEGLVQNENNQPVPNVDVYLNDGLTVYDRSDAHGRVTAKVLPGPYQLSVTPGFRIVKITQIQTPAGLPLFGIVIAADATTNRASAFLYRIQIQENNLAFMGLSGIGFGTRPDSQPSTGLSGSNVSAPFGSLAASPPVTSLVTLLALLTPRDLLHTTHGVRDLVIQGNRIHHNLLNPFNELMRQEARRFGRGGISLALGESIVIAGNQILDNGPRAIDPVCGIFIGYGDNVDIGDNVISNNGAFTPDYEENRVDGLRGGIFVRFAGALNLAQFAGRQPALRVHDNRVDQPAGRALTAFAFGPVACADNHFNSEFTGRWSAFDLLVGGVLIVNLAGLQRLLARHLDRSSQLTDASPDIKVGLAAPGKQVSISANRPGVISTTSSLGLSPSLVSLADAERTLPGGETLFNSNQVRLGPENRSLMSQFLLSLDDLGYDANQSSIFQDGLLLTNAFLYAATVRASDNRFAEAAAHTWSLYSQGRATNITAHNQGDHCLIVRGPANPVGGPLLTVSDPNVVLDFQFCRQFVETPSLVEYVAGVLGQALGANAGFTPNNVQLFAGPQVFRASANVAYAQVQAGQVAKRFSDQAEVSRLSAKYGAQHPRVLEEQLRLQHQATVLDELGNQAELVRMETPAAEARGTIIDGRVTDTRNRGQAGVIVELVNVDGSRVEPLGKTDASGYYAVSLNAERTVRLAQAGKVFLRFTDASGREIMRGDHAIKLAADTIHRSQVTIASPVIAPVILQTAKTVFPRSPAGESAADIGIRQPEPDKPAGPPPSSSQSAPTPPLPASSRTKAGPTSGHPPKRPRRKKP